VLSYHDKTFCPFWEKCQIGTECDRALTKEVAIEAKKAGLYICRFAEEPDCFETKGIEED